MNLTAELTRSLGARAYTSGPKLEEAARDFGRLIERRPRVVAQPATEQEVTHVVRLAQKHRVALAARGCGHSTHGQSQALDGIVLDLRSLNRVETVARSQIVVGAGATWEDVLRRTLPLGLTPPVLTDFLGLTVGGTLSVGGVGVQSFRHGTQADQVLELRVVTGGGETLDCSREQHAELFHACLAGLGQCGVIVRATLRLVAVPGAVRVQRTVFASARELLAAMETSTRSDACDGLQASLVENDPRRIAELFGANADKVRAMKFTGPWLHVLAAVNYRAPESVRVSDGADEQGHAQALPAETMSYFQFLARCRHILEPNPEKFGGVHDCPHPWLNLLLPADRCLEFVEHVLPEITEASCGRGPVLFCPLRRERLGVPLFRAPGSETSVKISILKNLTQPTPENIAAAFASNRRLYEACLERGGTRYPIDSVPMLRADWERHFGAEWAAFRRAKERWDPDHVLGAGENIFPPVLTIPA